MNEKKQFAEKSKEYSDLDDVIELAKQYSSYEKEGASEGKTGGSSRSGTCWEAS